MGGEVSTNVSKKEKRDNIRDRNIQVRDVETFIMSVFSCCSRLEGMWNILESKQSYKAFKDFVESELSSEYLQLYNECIKLKEVKKPSMYVLRKYVDTVLQDYVNDDAHNKIIMDEKLTKDLKAVLTDNIEGHHDPVGHMFHLLGRVESEVVSLMARDQFNRFLISRFYKNWRANERGRAVAFTSSDAKMQVQQYSARISARQISARNKSFRSVVPEDMSARAFSTMPGRERDTILETQSWLSTLVLGAELLPIGFSLAKVSKIRRGFPLVYVNNHFVKMTEFSKSFVIGKNCKDFLQCNETERDSIAQLSEALKQRQSITTILTNISETGRLFRNLMSLKPVFDNDGTFVYVIGLHIEVASDNSNEDEMGKILLMDQLLRILPNKIIEEVNERKPSGCWEALRLKWNTVVPASPRRNSAKENRIEKNKDNSDRLRQKTEAASAKLRARALSVEESNRKLAMQAANAARMRQEYSAKASNVNSNVSSIQRPDGSHEHEVDENSTSDDFRNSNDSSDWEDSGKGLTSTDSQHQGVKDEGLRDPADTLSHLCIIEGTNKIAEDDKATTPSSVTQSVTTHNNSDGSTTGSRAIDGSTIGGSSLARPAIDDK